MGGSTIADELTAYRVHLEAENKSPAAVNLWTGAARHLHAYLTDHGMPTTVRDIRREHLESWLTDLLASGAKPSTVNNRYRSVQPLWKWLGQEGSPTGTPKPPCWPGDPTWIQPRTRPRRAACTPRAAPCRCSVSCRSRA